MRVQGREQFYQLDTSRLIQLPISGASPSPNGYGLKHDYDRWFGDGRQLKFGPETRMVSPGAVTALMAA